MQEYTLEIQPEQSGKRLDVFLFEEFQKQNKGFSRTFIQRLIREGKAILNNTPVRKPHHKVKLNDRIRLCVEERARAALSAEEIPLDIVYEDKDVAVIYKPAGLVVHPGAGNLKHTLAHALLQHFKELSDINPQRPGIVHRLDKETSGLLVIAKNNASHLSLSEQFASHSVKRIYVALVKGSVEFDEQTIELPIGRHPRKRERMAVGFGKKTRFAKTNVRTLKRTKEYSLLELLPLTGRTHQLRVHLAYIGHPVLGDTKYGNADGFKRLALHAKTIGFSHPRTGKFLEFSCAMPEEFKSALKG